MVEHSMRDYTYPGQSKKVKEQIVDMALNGSGIRDTARVLHVSASTVIKELKKPQLQQVNLAALKQLDCESIAVDICLAKSDKMPSELEAELDEMWSFVGNKANQRWLW
ncbi:IS1-like element transposase [Chroococcidiopsis sp [FACHB-1243]]|uniref:IS1-like element transposase n=1 Tax=Chroococcidiopsis sp. [FACHB-1243] TaxID=2692781 RepID=UPI0018F029ED|nr:IS1-like element transposase [Chroococcidiopsis sp. [FACHB-1243]]